jgi:HTH-type transcriptional regulator, competence development regulator
LPLPDGVADELANLLVLRSPPKTVKVMVVFLSHGKGVDDAVAVREQMRLQHLRAKPLFRRPLAKDVQLLHGIGPPPMSALRIAVDCLQQPGYTSREKKARGRTAMRFGEKIRELRKAKNLGQRALAERVEISFTYLSKIENEKLDFGDYPSEELIRKLAKALDHDADDLLLLAKKIPEDIKSRVLERPDAFRKIASLGDEELDQLLKEIERKEKDK